MTQPDGVDNPWRWHTEADPYRDSAFGVLGVEPTTVLRRGHAGSRRQQVRYGSVQHLGRAVDEAAINAAEQRLRDPVGRVLETLRVHEVVPVEIETADLAADLAAVAGQYEQPEPAVVALLDTYTLRALFPRVRPRAEPPLPPLPPLGPEAFG